MFIPYKQNSTNATTPYDVSHNVTNLKELYSSEASVMYAHCWHYNTNPLKLPCEFFLLTTFTGWTGEQPLYPVISSRKCY
jgi:hypothetical protein